jgi:hypothetical protein
MPELMKEDALAVELSSTVTSATVSGKFAAAPRDAFNSDQDWCPPYC